MSRSIFDHLINFEMVPAILIVTIYLIKHLNPKLHFNKTTSKICHQKEKNQNTERREGSTIPYVPYIHSDSFRLLATIASNCLIVVRLFPEWIQQIPTSMYRVHPSSPSSRTNISPSPCQS